MASTCCMITKTRLIGFQAAMYFCLAGQLWNIEPLWVLLLAFHKENGFETEHYAIASVVRRLHIMGQITCCEFLVFERVMSSC